MLASSTAARSAELRVSALEGMPARQYVGKGTILPVRGYLELPARHPHAGRSADAGRLRLLVDGEPHMAWLDPHPDPWDCGRRHFFWSWVTLAPIQRAQTVELELVLIRAGERPRSGRLGSVDLMPGIPAPLPLPTPQLSPRIVVCMAAYEPDPMLLERQVRSLMAQTVPTWTCIIADDRSTLAGSDALERIAALDPRVTIAPAAPQRLGVYHNFERALALAPAWAEYVAFSDQDDDWCPDKLASLLADLATPGRTLTYSDMRIVSEAGRVLADTYWTTRRNNYTDLTSLLIANTVTGAATLFRAGLRDDLLPFPPRIEAAMHDWWTATTALALGDLGYVARPLYDYVQHGGNVLGHVAPERVHLSARALSTALRQRLPGAPKHVEMLLEARTCYLHHVRRVMLAARTLELRLGERIAPDKREAVWRIARLDESVERVWWLTARGVQRWGRRSETIGFDFALARGLAWRFGSSRLPPDALTFVAG